MATARRPFSLTARLTMRLTVVFAVGLVLWLGIFLLESFDEYRRDFGGRMADAAGIIGRSVVRMDGAWRIEPSRLAGETLRHIPELRVAVRRMTDGLIVP